MVDKGRYLIYQVIELRGGIMSSSKVKEGSLTEKNLINRIGIIRSMSELLQNTTLDKVSIDEICQNAGLSKATFYRQFSSKYDATQWVIRTYSSAGIDEIGRSLTWHEGLYRTTHGLDQHVGLLYAANQTKQIFEAPRKYSIDYRSSNIIETVVEWHHLELTSLLSFQIEAWSKLSSWLASEWHQGALRYEESEYLELLESVIPRELYDVLDKPVYPESEGVPDFDISTDTPLNLQYIKQKRLTLMAKAMLDTIVPT